jgi:cyclic pyranopterin phosphate synthase
MTLSHLDEQGRAVMVDVGAKPPSARLAVASGRLRMQPATLEQLVAGRLPKGDALTVARVAGIQAAKQTAQLIPLCHSLALTHVMVDAVAEPALPAVRVTATVRATGPTGVEMEALTAVAVALLTLYDMAKAVDRGMVIEDVALREKRGGQSGDWVGPEEA